MPATLSLPQVVLDHEEEARQAREAAPGSRTVVARYGYMRHIGEFPFDGKERLGCGSKLVARTERGTELAEMLTTVCKNGGCGHAVPRQQMLDYIDRSGGRNFPFYANGRVLRPATAEDLLEQQQLDTRKPEMLRFARDQAAQINLAIKLVEVELLLGGERIIFHYLSEQWVDFREMVKRLAGEYQTRIEMHQVNARDEARLVADYERCGQHCCCRQFLKVLKPVNMRMAKVQKATLDPAKISGRCGRLMCCLRYEDETYESLRKKLPRKQSRVLTPEGPGTVIDGQILTQLALVQLDQHESPAAFPVESLQPLPPQDDPLKNPHLPRPPERPPERAPDRSPQRQRGTPDREQRPRPPQLTTPPSAPVPGAPPAPDADDPPARESAADFADTAGQETDDASAAEDGSPEAGAPAPPGTADSPSRGYHRELPPQGQGPAGQPQGEGGGRRRRRRRRRRRGGGGGPGGPGSQPPAGGGPPPGPPPAA